jgi:hypothetical protein
MRKASLLTICVVAVLSISNAAMACTGHHHHKKGTGTTTSSAKH